MVSPQVEEDLKSLEEARHELVNVAMRITKDEDDLGLPIYPLDLLAFGVLNRGHYLISGFCSLTRSGNYSTAATLVRIHLDNALRFSASTLVSDPHDFSMKVMKGTEIHKLRDKKDVCLRDFHLVDELSKTVPWVKPVYKATCGLVHLSDKHIFQSTRATDGKGGFEARIGGGEDWVTDSDRREGIRVMKIITELIVLYMDAWAKQKRDAAAEMGWTGDLESLKSKAKEMDVEDALKDTGKA